MMENKGISLEHLKSVTAVHEADTLSDRYKFVNTMQVVDVMSKCGWYPSKANEVKARVVAKEGFQKHLVRFRQEGALSLSKRDSVMPEIVVSGSHDGSAAFLIMAGMWRQICSNGLMVSEGMFASHKIRHTGFCEEKVSVAIAAVLEATPKITDKLKDFQEITLVPDERITFAQSALQLKYDPAERYVNPKELLKPLRHEDDKPTLWNTFNTVQEKFMNGGVKAHHVGVKGEILSKSIKTRAIKSVSEDVRLNRALWMLTEKMAQLKTG